MQARRNLDALFRESKNFWEVIRSRVFYEILPNARTSKFDEAIVSITHARTLPSTIAIIASNFKQIHGMAQSLEEALHERTPLAELSEVIANLDYDVEKFVRDMGDALEKAKERKTGNDYENGVKLLTYFKSKGLQWHTVVLLSCNEGIMPRRGEDLESERRLFYVGMTRASANLVISYVDNLCGASIQPSRFLYESGFALSKV